MNQRLLPRRLRPGDVVGVVAPAGPFDRRTFVKGLAQLQALGLVLRCDEEIFRKSGYLAGSDEMRAAQINRCFADPGISGIVCARGGYGTLRLLPRIDFETVRRHPKIFMGFSDITALLAAFWFKCRLVTFHGPVVTTLAAANPVTRAGVRAFLMDCGRNVVKPRNPAVLREGLAEGTLLGGNLTTLCHLVGTDFAPLFEDCILFLEDVGEAPYRIDRMLTQMKMAGCFKGLRGLVLGSFRDCGPRRRIYRIAADLLDDAAIPILGGFAIGHDRTHLTLPVGVPAVLDVVRRELVFLSSATVAGQPERARLPRK